MSSPYAILDNRPIDQWKVTELREELKKRKLAVKGLKEDLVKRLDEAIRNEHESDKGDADNGFGTAPESGLQSEQAGTESVLVEKSKELMEIEKVYGNTPKIETDDIRGAQDKGKVRDGEVVHGTDSVGVEEEAVTALSGQHFTSETESKNGISTGRLDNDDLKSCQEDPVTKVPEVCESGVSEVLPGALDLQSTETQNETTDSKEQLEYNVESFQADAELKPSDLNYQVSEVNPDLGSQVTSDSVSIEYVSIVKKNELKVDVITDDVKLEMDVNHERVQPSPSNVVPDAGESHPMDAEEPQDIKVSVKETDGSIVKNVDTIKKDDSGDLGSPEKLNLDQNSGNDSMEEDILEIKQMDFKSNSDEMNETVRKTEMQILEEKDHVNVSGDFKLAEKMVLNVENKEDSVQTSLKRKFHDKAAVGNNDIVKRRCRWNSDGLKVPEPQSGNVMASTTPKDSIQPPFKHSFSRSDSRVSEEEPKERVVPPASLPPTNSLRIDCFLRPFTLKAVQELLGKKGTITSFWMDHIKTHCYVSYSSIEEAIETRNTVYNLQWPPNGGRMLVAEFVDPQEVKTRVEVPPPSPATPSSSAAPTFAPQNTLQSQPSPQQQVQRQQLLPPPPLPPPPPLANPPTAREHPLPAAAREQPLPVRERLNLPPPPPLSEKVDPPIVTLDDLFQKTKATPRIYYLPLSDEQVAAKLNAQGKNGSSRD